MFTRIQKILPFVAVTALIVIAVCEVYQTRAVMSASEDFAVIRSETVAFNCRFRRSEREFRETQECLVNEAQQFNKTVNDVAEKVPVITSFFPAGHREASVREKPTQLARP